MPRLSREDWYQGIPKAPGWYLTGYLNGKGIYRYWLRDVWSEPITTDTSVEEHLDLGIQPSPMSAAVTKYQPLGEVPNFLVPFTTLIGLTARLI